MTTNDHKFDQFSIILQSELVERTRKNIELLRPERVPGGPVPFALTKAFEEIYPEIVKVGIFPIVISRRPVRAIQGDVDWGTEGRDYLLNVLDDRSNAVFVAWDAAWEALWDERRVALGHRQTATGKKGGLFGSIIEHFIRSSRSESTEKVTTEPVDDEEILEGLFSMLSQFAERHGTLPLLPDDIKIFRGLMRTKPSRLASAWKELTQYHNQEFIVQGENQAKPGVLSEALQKWHVNLPERIGELLVVKAAVDLEHVDKAFIGKYIRQSARTQEEAERGMPYLALYWKNMRGRR